jgi:hypothetical protein
MDVKRFRNALSEMPSAETVYMACMLVINKIPTVPMKYNECVQKIKTLYLGKLRAQIDREEYLEEYERLKGLDAKIYTLKREEAEFKAFEQELKARDFELNINAYERIMDALGEVKRKDVESCQEQYYSERHAKSLLLQARLGQPLEKGIVNSLNAMYKDVKIGKNEKDEFQVDIINLPKPKDGHDVEILRLSKANTSGQIC